MDPIGSDTDSGGTILDSDVHCVGFNVNMLHALHNEGSESTFKIIRCNI